jgi:hypothetical protein
LAKLDLQSNGLKFRLFGTASQRRFYLLKLPVAQGILELKLVLACEAVEGFEGVVFQPKKQVAGHQPKQGRRETDGQQGLEAEAAFLQAQRLIVVLQAAAFLVSRPVLFVPVVALLQVLLGAVFGLGEGPLQRGDAPLLLGHQPLQ